MKSNAELEDRPALLQQALSLLKSLVGWEIAQTHHCLKRNRLTAPDYAAVFFKNGGF